MKNTFKKIAAVMAAVSVMGTASMSVSAATKEDVVAAARGAGFLEEYVMVLQNWLNGNNFNSDQYDTMVNMLYSAGSEMDEVALDMFGKTVAEMKGAAEEKADKEGTDVDDSWLSEIAGNMKDENITDILDEIVSAGKELGLDVTFEKKGDKEYILTVKDKDGNIQLVTPIGKLVDRTGVSETENNAVLPLAFAGVTAIGCAGAYVLVKSLKKDEENA